MEIANLYLRSSKTIEKLNLFDDVDSRLDYIEVINITQHSMVPECFSLIYRQLYFELPDHSLNTCYPVENYEQYRTLPNGKKHYKGDGMYVGSQYRQCTVHTIIENKRPYWTDDYSHMKGELTICDNLGKEGRLTCIGH